jgi:hypothetical protein
MPPWSAAALPAAVGAPAPPGESKPSNAPGLESLGKSLHPGAPDAEDRPLAEQIAQQVERVILQRTGGRIRRLNVEIRGGEIVLTGRADTYYIKQLATHAATQAAAGYRLQNAIDVV